ncbi:MAG: hypothetical protein WBV56_09580 [Azonexus sp.]
MMRNSLSVVLLLSALLAACASDTDVLKTKDIAPSGALKVHPALLGAPAVTPKGQDTSQSTAAPAKADSAEAPMEQQAPR